MKNNVLHAFLIVLIGFLCPLFATDEAYAVSDSVKAKMYKIQAEKYIKKRDEKTALKYILRLRKLKPESANQLEVRLYSDLAAKELKSGNKDRAQAYIEKVKALDPAAAQNLQSELFKSHIGELKLDIGQALIDKNYSKAEQLLDQLAGFDTATANIMKAGLYKTMIDYYRQSGDEAKTITSINKLETFDPETARSMMIAYLKSRIQLHLDSGNDEQALAAIQKLEPYQPDLTKKLKVKLYLTRVKNHLKQQNHIKALKDMEILKGMGITLPGAFHFYYARSTYETDKESLDSVKNSLEIFFKDAEETDPNFEKALMLLAEVEEKLEIQQKQLEAVVIDPLTGLMWQKEEPGKMSWQTAIDYCSSLDLASYKDWKLPDRLQLKSGYKIRSSFPHITRSLYWSVNTHKYDKAIAWSIFFDNGSFYNYYKVERHYVRCVRGGQ